MAVETDLESGSTRDLQAEQRSEPRGLRNLKMIFPHALPGVPTIVLLIHKCMTTVMQMVSRLRERLRAGLINI